MTEFRKCPDCGIPIPAGAPDRICPRCLLQVGVDTALENTLVEETIVAEVVATDDPAAFSIMISKNRPEKTALHLSGETKYFGDYELLHEIARGGMGVVYKARQVGLNRVIALKMILSGQFAGEADVERFYKEAEAAAHLDHVGIVPVFEVGEHEGHHYFSMGLVEGDSLATRLKTGPMPFRVAAEIVRQVALAIQYAHDRGVIHRDLKPANILLTVDGIPKVTDFGLAKLSEGDSGLTGTGQVLGTPSFMPPEQAGGGRVGREADIYSLGAILYCLLTGHPPFQAASVLETLKRVIEQDPVAPRLLNVAIPPDLETISLKCLEKDPLQRYSSADQLAKELQRYLDGEPILARPVSVFERSWRWAKRKPVLAGFWLSLVTLLLTFAIGGPWMAIQQRSLTQQARDAYEKQILAQIESLLQANSEAVPTILATFEDSSDVYRPRLEKMWSQNSLTPTGRTRLALALMPQYEAAAHLEQQLLTASVEDFLVIRSALADRVPQLIPDLWNSMDDAETASPQQLRAAAALADYAPNDPKWAIHNSIVVDRLLELNPLLASRWVEAFRPAKHQLVPPLQQVFMKRSGDSAKRFLATSILADYAEGNVELLVELTLVAEDWQFKNLFGALNTNRTTAIQALRSKLEQELQIHEKASTEKFSNCVIALCRLGECDSVWPLLELHPDPSLRTELIHQMAQLELEPQIIFEQIANDANPSIQQALLLSLGEYEPSGLPAEFVKPNFPRSVTKRDRPKKVRRVLGSEIRKQPCFEI
ncbi:MAG: serine/threonine-protein kinase [Planctomycetaceae bacterium]